MRTTLRRGSLLVAAALLAARRRGRAPRPRSHTRRIPITSLYYKEFKKDGRCLRVQRPRRRGRFEAIGRDGRRASRRIGVGPNGETVFADNETAIELFFFKHGVIGEGRAAAAAAARDRLARRQDALHDRQQLLPGDVEPHPGPLLPQFSRRLGQAGRHRERRRQQGQLPDPPRQVQARRLDVPAGHRVRVAAQLARRHRHAGFALPRGREHRLGPDAQEAVPRPLRPVQGALRPPAAHLLGLPAVRRPRDHRRPLQPGPRNGARAVGHARHEQVRISRHDLERQRPIAGDERQRQVPLHRARAVPADRRRRA